MARRPPRRSRGASGQPVDVSAGESVRDGQTLRAVSACLTGLGSHLADGLPTNLDCWQRPLASSRTELSAWLDWSTADG